MMALSFLFTLAAASVAMVGAYDIGCIYPERMPDPFQVQFQLVQTLGLALARNKTETPIVVHRGHQTTYCQSNCVAYHDTTALNVITHASPVIRTPREYHNSWSRAMCIAQCYGMLQTALGMAVQSTLGNWRFEILPMNNELIACESDAGCLEQLLLLEDWDPRLIGQVVALEIAESMTRDGWNAFGSLTWDWETEEPVACSTNCAPYSDTTGYYPINQPGPIDNSNKRGKNGKSNRRKNNKEQDVDKKYRVEGKDAHWRPIQEHNGNGYFSRQEHVTPHIGYTVKPVLIKEWKEAPEPQYDFLSEAELVVDRLRHLSSSEDQKTKVNFFDNKILVRGLLQHYLTETFLGDLTFEDYMLFIHCISAAEHDAVLQAWREKVRHDMVRPTTVIQRWGHDILNTFSGDHAATSAADIRARDFQPFIRVMPHSEYPSGSACLCTAYAEFTDAFIKQEFNVTSMGPLLVGPPGITDGNDHFLGCPNAELGVFVCLPWEEFSVQDVTDLKRIYGQSRLWGGMHFTKSIEAAEEICSGIGTLGLDLFNKLKGSSNRWGDTYVIGDPRPTCSR